MEKLSKFLKILFTVLCMSFSFLPVSADSDKNIDFYEIPMYSLTAYEFFEKNGFDSRIFTDSVTVSQDIQVTTKSYMSVLFSDLAQSLSAQGYTDFRFMWNHLPDGSLEPIMFARDSEGKPHYYAHGMDFKGTDTYTDVSTDVNELRAIVPFLHGIYAKNVGLNLWSRSSYTIAFYTKNLDLDVSIDGLEKDIDYVISVKSVDSSMYASDLRLMVITFTTYDIPSRVNPGYFINLPSISTSIVPVYVGLTRYVPNSLRPTLGFTDLYIDEINELERNVKVKIDDFSMLIHSDDLIEQAKLDVIHADNLKLFEILTEGDSSSQSGAKVSDALKGDVSASDIQMSSIDDSAKKSLDSASKSINSGYRISVKDKFVSSAKWVSDQYMVLVKGTPFEHVLMFCLTLGISLAFIGKIRSG